jgi:multiple sugar transport system substrate-binding protein
MGFMVNRGRRLRAWRRGLLVGLAAALRAACGGGTTGGGGGGTPTLNWYTFPEPSGSFAAAAKECSAASGGEYSIQIRELPTAADGQREQLVRRSAARDSYLDILGLDVVWEAEFAEAGWKVPFTGERRRQVTQDAVKAALDTATWKGSWSPPRSTATPSCCGTARTWCPTRPGPGPR